MSLNDIKKELQNAKFQNITVSDEGLKAFYYPVFCHCGFSVTLDKDGKIKEIKDITSWAGIGKLILGVIILGVLVGVVPGAMGIAVAAYLLREYNKGDIEEKVENLGAKKGAQPASKAKVG